MNKEEKVQGECLHFIFWVDQNFKDYSVYTRKHASYAISSYRISLWGILLKRAKTNK